MIFLVLASIPLAKVKKFQTLAKKHAFLIQKQVARVPRPIYKEN